MRLRWQFDTMQPWVARWVRKAMKALGVVPSQDYWDEFNRVECCRVDYFHLHRRLQEERAAWDRRVAHLEFCNKAYMDRLVEIAAIQPNPMFVLDMTTGKLTDAEKWKPNAG